jgi:hypothetical protein
MINKLGGTWTIGVGGTMKQIHSLFSVTGLSGCKIVGPRPPFILQ